MGSQKKVRIETFIDLKYKQHKTSKEICELCDISYKTYLRYNKEAKPLVFNKINTNKIEKEIIALYNNTNDINQKIKVMPQIIKIWEAKHKIPSVGEEKSTKFDFSKLIQPPSFPSSTVTPVVKDNEKSDE